MQAKVLKWGNSLAVRIPKVVAEGACFKAGDALEIVVDPNGTVQLHRVSKVPTLAQMVAKITPESRYAEVLTGAETGRETIEW
jgi:antitoxin MazE